MNKNNGFLTILAGLMISSSLQASTPLWTYSAPSPARVTIASGQTASVQYTVTNQSIKEKNLLLKTTSGLSASPCYLQGEGSTCTLTLTINGSQIPESGLYTGPVLYEEGNPNQCYQPEAENRLQITRSSLPPVEHPGHLQLSLNGNPVTSLLFRLGDSGSLILTNTGLGNLTALTIGLPFSRQSYFTNNCPTELLPQQSCTLTYVIPTPAATGILNPLTVQATHTDNSLNIPVNIQALGAAKCWGVNSFGQLGSATNSGTNNSNNSPLQVQTLSSGVTAITGASSHTCALLDTGAVKCWGINHYGQLGSTTNSGNFNANNSPLEVQTLSSSVIAITAGGGAHICALLDTGAVKCWGYNRFGQLGATTNSGSATNPNNSPLQVQTLSSGVKAITAGYEHTCALLDTGAVKCWGSNEFGQLGSTTNSGTTTPNNSPLEVQTLSSGVIAITGGYHHTCALLDTGAVKCWGVNRYGQLGSTTNSGSATTPNNSPLQVQTLSSGVIAITGGAQHTCALLDTGAVKCWGWNAYGQLGSTTNSGTSTPSNSPLQVQTLSSGVIAITAGLSHTCALLDNGAVKCWGWNFYGQLGSTTNNGTNSTNNSPLQVQTLSAGSSAALLNHNLGSNSCAIVY